MTKKKILITSFDLAIGGVERSLIGLLNNIDYKKYDVDLVLFKHGGEFFPFLPEGPNLISEIPQYSTFRSSISQIIKEGYYSIGISRVLAKIISSLHGRIRKIEEPGYLSIQYGWGMSKSFLPKLHKEYDVAIGFLWPHYFIGEKVKAKKKIGWIHTDYSNIYLNKKLESKMWKKVDKIVAVSEECSKTFTSLFPEFNNKTTVIENILSLDFIQQQADLEIPREIKKSKGKTILLTVGRLTFAKGLDDAIKACRALIDKDMNIEWYVIGYGPLEKDLEELIKKLGLQDKFFLLGKKTNPYPYMKACDIYVQPSRYEGKAVTIREAQILGKPVVLTNFPTAKSQARDGVDAHITEPNVEGIVNGIRKMIEDNQFREKIISNVEATDYGNKSELPKLYRLIES